MKVFRSCKVLKPFVIVLALLVTSVAVYAATLDLERYQSNPGDSFVVTDTSGGGCKMVTNSSSNSYFIPTKTTAEWDAFKNAAQRLSVSLSDCSGSQNFTTPGTHTFTVPIGVTSVKVSMSGGGGGGGNGARGSNVSDSLGRGGGGGGGGGKAAQIIDASLVSVVSGTIINIAVGAGGTSSAPGGGSSFETLLAVGGLAGANGSTYCGQADGCTGAIGLGTGGGAGGKGGAAGTFSASNGSPGNPPELGFYGAGGGGGGGGGGIGSGGSKYGSGGAGGAGAPGFVKVEW